MSSYPEYLSAYEQAMLTDKASSTSTSILVALFTIAAILFKLFSEVNLPTEIQSIQDKSFIFDESSESNNSQLYQTVEAPIYLVSALLSGLNTLPSEAILKSGSQRARGVRYESYRRLSAKWIPLPLECELSGNAFASSSSMTLHRLIDLPSMDEGEQLIGTLRIYRFTLREEDMSVVNGGLMTDLMQSEIAGVQGMNVSNAGGYHSTTDLFVDGKHALLGGFCSAAVKIAEQHDLAASRLVNKEKGGKSVEGDISARRFQEVADEAWINRNKHGHWNSMHTHTGSTWSGIYYVRSALEASVRGHSGSLLIKPSAHISEVKLLSTEDMRRLNTYSVASSENIHDCNPELGRCDFLEIKPESGVLLVFPSYLQHAVLPLCISKSWRQADVANRVSVAFNYAEMSSA